MDRRLVAVVVATLATAAAACSSATPGTQPTGEAASAAATSTVVIAERYTLQQSLDFTITLTTTSVGGTFGRLDRKHTCERGDTSPHVAWEGLPEGAESLALVMEDSASDALGLLVDVLWTHWVVYSIPSNVIELQPGQVAGEFLENGAKQGANDYGRVQYNGPCPIPTLSYGQRVTGGSDPLLMHIKAEDRPYYLRLYALDIPVDLPPAADRDTLLEVIDGHILEAGELAVNYKSIKGVSCRVRGPELCLKTVQR